MRGLAPEVDQAVRNAVAAFLEGRLRPEHAGELCFETKHSRYRLIDGVLFAAPDATLVGAELVGWLIEGATRSSVEPAWQAASRAVLVDPKRARHIIVTSSTRRMRRDEPRADGSGADQDGSSVHPPAPLKVDVKVEAKVEAEVEVKTERLAPPRPALPSVTTPPRSLRARIPACPPLPGAGPNPAPTSRPLPLPSPPPRVHTPPRPMQPRIPQATAPRPFTRPLPYPAAPPRRASALPLPTPAARRLGPLPAPARLPLPPQR